jgi:hypothetical protein
MCSRPVMRGGNASSSSPSARLELASLKRREEAGSSRYTSRQRGERLRLPAVSESTMARVVPVASDTNDEVARPGTTGHLERWHHAPESGPLLSHA